MYVYLFAHTYIYVHTHNVIPSSMSFKQGMHHKTENVVFHLILITVT